MNRPLLISCLLASAGSISAFAPPQSSTVSAIGHRRSITPLFSAIVPPPEERSDANPSTKFGSPLSDGLKEANRWSIGFLKGTIFDTFFAGEDRAYARFYALETIARVPYFSYLSVLHLYETLGRWRRAKYLKFLDRFLAQHIAFGYYGVVILSYLINPIFAYNLNQDVEEHAFSTYDEYLRENEEMLKGQPAPQAAIDYYIEGDMYMFDEFQTTCEMRRPKIENLYDVFVAIRDDEAAHVETMKALQTELDVASIHDGECESTKMINYCSLLNKLDCCLRCLSKSSAYEGAPTLFSIETTTRYVPTVNN
eukprot:scaffold2728_cov137-Skeletonema_marinoi.AAC.13